MARQPFQKPALSLAVQLNLLQQRGMQIPDLGIAEHYLRFIGYYRLAGYWFPFQYRNGSLNHNNFMPGTSFSEALDRYIFDRRLRVLVMDAVERIEVSARSTISNTMSEANGPHWQLNRTNFRPGFNHQNFLRIMRQETGVATGHHHKQPVFVQHYLQKYDNPPDPPSWMVFECLSFGAVSKMFPNLPRQHQKSIASMYGLPRQRLASWLHAISHVRNLCAHHSRVWNRTFGVTPSVDRQQQHHISNPQKFYNQAVAIQTLLRRISGDTHWADHLAALLADYPGVPVSEMGFPLNWRREAIWL
ncbi:MAG: Abi family protein [Rhizobiaceae bacterium]|nr:Abi family protein [Rhizobiaceae bacterium]